MPIDSKPDEGVPFQQQSVIVATSPQNGVPKAERRRKFALSCDLCSNQLSSEFFSSLRASFELSASLQNWFTRF